jgi:hypothetical protein
MISSKEYDDKLSACVLNVIDDVIKCEVAKPVGEQTVNSLVTSTDSEAIIDLTKRVEEIVNKRIESTLGCKIGINNLHVMKNDANGRKKIKELFKEYDSDENSHSMFSNNMNDIIRKKQNLVVMEVDIDSNNSATASATTTNNSIVDPWDSDYEDTETAANPHEDMIKHDKHDNHDKHEHKSNDKGDDKGDDNIEYRSFRDYLEEVDNIDELRSMFISMILDFKERVRGCENCETCSQIIQIVETNIKKYKKVSKLAYVFSTIFIHMINDVIPDKLNENQINLLNVIFVLLVKNSKFPDLSYVYDKFKQFINVNAFDGLVLRIAIQKFKSVEIRIMLLEWKCNITVLEHRPIIRAFHYEKFGVVRTLIELGSSYKYYLQKELSELNYKIFQMSIDDYLDREMPNSSRIEKELRIVGMINDYRLMIRDSGEDDLPLSNDYFIEEFLNHFLNIISTNGTSSIDDTDISTNTRTSTRTSKKNKKNKKKNKKNKKPTAETNDNQTLLEPIMEVKSIPQCLDNLPSGDSNTDNTVSIDLLNDETFGSNDYYHDDCENCENGEDEPKNKDAKEKEIIETENPARCNTDTITKPLKIESKCKPWKSIYKSSGLDWAVETYWDNHFYNIFGKYMIC